MTPSRDPLREQLIGLLEWHDAHLDFESAVQGVPPELQGAMVTALPFSPWQLLEHMRLAQHDILDFCRNPDYEEMDWPDDYWPKSAAPPDAEAWDASVGAFGRDRAALKEMVANGDIDLFAAIPHGSGQTYLREVLLVADHNAYHLGQLVALRRQLGIWPG